MLAMILAGGKGSRLGKLTKNIAKPAVPFGGRYRIIDFTLSNCANSGIKNVGVVTQYQPLALNNHVDNGTSWGWMELIPASRFFSLMLVQKAVNGLKVLHMRFTRILLISMK